MNQERDELIVKLVKAGVPPVQIARHVGLSRQRVRQIMGKHGLYVEPNKRTIHSVRAKRGNLFYVKQPDHPRANKRGWVMEHILIAEAKLSRPIEKDEIIIHLDGDTTNNRAENLEVRKRGARRKWTDEELIARFRALALKLGHTPRAKDLGGENPSQAAYVNRFGSLTEAARRAGLVPNERRTLGASRTIITD